MTLAEQKTALLRIGSFNTVPSSVAQKPTLAWTFPLHDSIGAYVTEGSAVGNDLQTMKKYFPNGNCVLVSLPKDIKIFWTHELGVVQDKTRVKRYYVEEHLPK